MHATLHQAVVDKVFPGAVLAVRHGGDQLWLAAVGNLSTDPHGSHVTSTTVYDLASLTKPLVVVTSLALLVQEGRCGLDDRIAAWLPELEAAPVAHATLRQLLTHCSGLPGWRGYYERMSAPATLPSSPQARTQAGKQVLELIQREMLIYGRGERSVYSDLGFILLGLVIERLSGTPLDQFAYKHIIHPLKAEPLCYLPADPAGESRKLSLRDRIAPTEWDAWRGRLLWGEVHDENAAALGNVAGHAGLFGTAESVLAVTGAWLKSFHRRPSILNPDVARDFSRRQETVPESSWALGWDTPSSASSAGKFFSSRSFGHLGYTGTSIWVDPTAELEVVLLSNRVHPTRKNEAIRTFRPIIHDLVYRTCVGVR